MNISFLEQWQFNQKLPAPPLRTYQAWKIVDTIRQNMKVTELKNINFPTL